MTKLDRKQVCLAFNPHYLQNFEMILFKKMMKRLQTTFFQVSFVRSSFDDISVETFAGKKIIY